MDSTRASLTEQDVIDKDRSLELTAFALHPTKKYLAIAEYSTVAKLVLVSCV